LAAGHCLSEAATTFARPRARNVTRPALAPPVRLRSRTSQGELRRGPTCPEGHSTIDTRALLYHSCSTARDPHGRAGVVGHAHHQAERREGRGGFGRPINARARALPSARSSGVSRPCSRSQSAIARRPASCRNLAVATCASQPLNDVPSRVAALSMASARSGGRETDRLDRRAITVW
jgi:hypothetical protein